MTNTTMPSDVCLYCVEKHNLSVDGNWALFEVSRDGNYGRLPTSHIWQKLEYVEIKSY